MRAMSLYFRTVAITPVLVEEKFHLVEGYKIFFRQQFLGLVQET